MRETCGRAFDEALLSGYVDGMLTQADEQRVRLHLEDCTTCRSQVEEMTQIREVTMSSRFKVPVDDQWSESPRGGLSRFSFGLGWLLLVAWVAAVVGAAAWEWWTSDTPFTWDTLVAFAFIAGVILLFVSVLVDRLKTYGTDRYREVRK